MNVNKRKLAREHMMKVAFQMDARNDFRGEDREVYMDRGKIKYDKKYCEKMYELLVAHHDEIDCKISEYSKDWEISRIPKIDLSVIRTALLEILYFDDIDPAISINEAVNMAKKYGLDTSPGFVNAVLGAIYKNENR
ncbi:transcription antitermination factor NusB [Anaerovoracaceae bacterium SGI.195]